MGKSSHTTADCKSQGGTICWSSTLHINSGCLSKNSLFPNGEGTIHDVENKIREIELIFEGNVVVEEVVEGGAIYGNRKTHRIVVEGEDKER